jgi:hypothetical protein
MVHVESCCKFRRLTRVIFAGILLTKEVMRHEFKFNCFPGTLVPEIEIQNWYTLSARQPHLTLKRQKGL